jgi:hypothetical protein
MDQVVRHDWVVYAKRPFGGPKLVLKYLARYTHRVAISNRRLVAMHDGRVTFRWKDYAQEGRQRRMTLAATEFIRRFLLHVLPHGFVKIRHYGFMANRFRQAKRELCRRLLDVPSVPSSPSASDERPANDLPETIAIEPACRPCPHCRDGHLRILLRLPPQIGRPRSAIAIPAYQDTS